MFKLSENKEDLADCIKEWKKVFEKRLSEMALYCFDEIGCLLNQMETERQDRMEIDKPIDGFSTNLLKAIKENVAEDKISEWMMGLGKAGRASAVSSRFAIFSPHRTDAG